MSDWLIAGLGNPGAKYDNTPHNIGFRVIDQLALDSSLSFSGKFNAQIASGKVFSGPEAFKAYLLKPLSFMNASGGPVGQAAAYFKIPPSNVIIIHDDIDLEFGRIKIKIGGSAGGHNGIRSIEQHLKTQEFYRVRVGVGRGSGPAEAKRGDKSAAAHVLGGFSSAQASELPSLIEDAIKATQLLVNQGLDKAQQTFH
jgi:PTH1 family peptidyl-tRNA hydrolase